MVALTGSAAARVTVAALHVLAFFAATAWGFGIGHEVDGAWLGMLMGLSSGVCAVLLLDGLHSAWLRLMGGQAAR
jgi:hypothetical protein